ncbi:arsenite S-adenosylmethyltransferase [candidate division WOR_3 bacterium SM1_77]|uniref:Arsenite methyltransferase n=1 Tax=candidate division WOR_3 bacterium SM1_77 TaxID=1703778 RepID=A0A0S8JXC0_UNCW3|nr:MAG: arsenite S-adenosylmethyltransferase [candidate division WOR_3 bacterium SM1_77]
MKDHEIKQIVRKSYAKAAKRTSCCGPQPAKEGACCGDAKSKNIGYNVQELESVPEGSDLGLGCGNPVAIASLKTGETVLDLGAGAGFDCFLAAKKVGQNGKVIGVDMTPEMIDRARENAQKGDYDNVEFRLGEIEHLPVADNSVDAVISNCVINLAPNKYDVMKEVYRVLKPGGRVAISDLALRGELPIKIRNNMAAYVSCVAGAIHVDEYKKAVVSAGFRDVKFTINKATGCSGPTEDQKAADTLKLTTDEYSKLSETVVSVYIEARK